MKMFYESQGNEIKYLVRWVQGNLKIGAAQLTMQFNLFLFRSALSRAFFIYLNGKKLKENDFNDKLEIFEKTLKKCFCEYPD